MAEDAVLMREAHVWLLRPDNVEPELMRRWGTVLSDEERQRQARFLRQEDAHIFLAAHALARLALSYYLPVRPVEWCFKADQYGRPWVVPDRGLYFNLSHTRGLAACLVSDLPLCGVDVELSGRVRDPLEIAGSNFSPTEHAVLRECPPEERQRLFTETWVLKEAYTKARGQGIALPLEKFTFLARAGAVDVRFEPDLGDDPGRWQMELRWVDREFAMAVALAEGRRRVVVREVSLC